MSGRRTLAEEVADALGNTAPWAIEAIRRNERTRLSALLNDSADIIGEFAKDGPAAVRAVAYMLTLQDGETMVGFLLARIESEEALARDVAGRMEHVPPATIGGVGNLGLVGYPFARVLAECAAKRAIVEECADTFDLNTGEAVNSESVWLAEAVLKALASVYADHPDYPDAQA